MNSFCMERPLSGDHELVLGGYGQVAKALRDGIHPDGKYKRPLRDVRLGHVVTKISRPAGAAAGGGAKRGAVCKVYVKNQKKPIEAQVVLCTLPLGVLQHGDVAFEPKLPPFKQSAIDNLGMGTENRVAMLFDPADVFWPEDAHFLRPVRGRYTFANLHALGLTGVLCAWVRAKHIEEVEAMTDVEAFEDVMSTLRSMFRERVVQPREYKVTRWSQDPFSRGSYSYVPVGAFKVRIPYTGPHTTAFAW